MPTYYPDRHSQAFTFGSLVIWRIYRPPKTSRTHSIEMKSDRGKVYRLDAADPRKVFYLDPHDGRRRRPKGMVSGSALIWVYLWREMTREGCDLRPSSFSLVVDGWKVVDRIRTKARIAWALRIAKR